MRIFIQANEEQKKELDLSIIENSTITITDSMPLPEEYSESDAFFILDKNTEEINFEIFGGKPLFINEVIHTLKESEAPKNVSRINAWPTFLARDTWELAGSESPDTKEIFQVLNKKVIVVTDTPGMVAARVVSMIINEAFYALKEKVSTKKEIDLAMKLGTNYPYGPFEWADKIGLERVYLLLLKISQTDERCIPSFDYNDFN